MTNGVASMHFVYILRCNDGSFYVGTAKDLKKRVAIHNSGEGASYTASRLPAVLMYHECYAALDEAVRRERQLKGWSHIKKAALICGDLERLKESSKSRRS